MNEQQLNLLKEEIKKDEEIVKKDEALQRLKDIMAVYNGEDRVVSSKELQEEIKSRPEELKILSGIEGLDNILGGFRLKQLITLSGLTKQGKCLGKGEEVLMYDGSIKKVEDIVVGDKVMGPDSNPRKVLSLGRGKEEMFRVSQRGGSYVVNKSHILSLKRTGTNKFRYDGLKTKRKDRKGELKNISVEDYLSSSNAVKHIYKGWKTGIDFPSQDVSIEPYFLGVWLGDGTAVKSNITSVDEEIVNYLEEYSKRIGLDFSKKQNKKRTPSYTIGRRKGSDYKRRSLTGMLNDYNLIKNKHIPKEFLVNDKEKRLELLAGIIDTDGHIEDYKYPAIEITQKSKRLANDIYYLASSLGYQVTVKPCKKGVKSNNFVGNYFRIRISGDLSQIPTKINRKKSRFTPKRNILTSNIKIESIGVGDYYGFEIDGDGLFVLGNFIVTHNTSYAVDLTSRLKDFNPLWFPFEEGAEELIQKFLDRGEDAPLFYTPRTMKQNQLKWLEDKIVESIAKYGTRIVFIDHLHFIVPFTTNRQDLAIGNVMRLLKQIATKWNIVIFLMAHLKKVKSDTQPSIDDLRDASWIGQESDTVMIIWRQTKRNRDGEVVITNNTNISVQANRRTGKTGNVKMVFLDGKFFEQEWADEKNDY